VFSDGGEGGEQVGEDEEVADFLAEVGQLKLAAFGFGAYVDASERAEARRVHPCEVGEVEDDALVGGEELRDRKVEEVGVAREQLAVTADEGGCAAVFDLDVEGFGTGGLGHLGSLEEPILSLRVGKRFELRSNAHISKSRYGYPIFTKRVRCGPPAL
jgi:hypothetical protein